MKLIDRAKSWFRGAEGSQRGTFYGQGHLGNWFGLGHLEDGYQRDLTIDSFTLQRIPAVSGAKHLYRSAFSQLWPDHKHIDNNGNVTMVRTSAASRVMMVPNDYETGAAFNARLVDAWITYGEVLVLATRNNRYEVASMHIVPPGSWQWQVDEKTKEIYYLVNEHGSLLTPVDATVVVPSRDCVHLRWATPHHPLIGESPLRSAGIAAGIHSALSRSQTAFFSNMNRPSGVISTDSVLTREQMATLRAAWDDQSKRMAQGGVPILASGMKWQPMSVTSSDAEVIATLKMSNDEIYRAMGVPPPLLGALENATLANTEQLVQAWLSFSLGGLLERYERAFDKLFGFNPRVDRIEMSVDALLRSNLDGRMSALSKGIQGGVLSPNEARQREGLSPVDGGDQIFLQRQNTPLDLLSQLALAELEASTAPPPPAPVPGPEQEVGPDPVEEENAKAIAYSTIKKAMLS